MFALHDALPIFRTHLSWVWRRCDQTRVHPARAALRATGALRQTTRPDYPPPNPRGDGAEHSGHPEHRRLGAAQEGQLQRPEEPTAASAVRTWHDTPDLVRKRPAPT